MTHQLNFLKKDYRSVMKKIDEKQKQKMGG